MIVFRIALFVFLTILISACNNEDTYIKPMPVGAYIGQTSNQFYFNVLILPNGDYWSVVGIPLPTRGMRVIGVMAGRGYWDSADSESFTTHDAKGILFHAADSISPIQETLPVQMSTRFSGQGGFNGTADTVRFGALEFSGNRIENSRFDIYAPPNIESLMGMWSGTSINQEATFLQIFHDGSFIGKIGDCSYSGVLLPHPEQLNMHVGELTVGSEPCKNPGVTFKGVAVAIPIEGVTKTQLLMAGFDESRSKGIAFSAVR